MCAVIDIKRKTLTDMQINLVGYHGTDSSLVPSIQQNNFIPSTANRDWVGHGVYFFIEGVGCPVGNATEWAKNQAYDRLEPKYSHFSILQADVKCERLLDVRTDKALNVYNQIRNAMIQKFKNVFRKCNHINESDCKMWNLVSEYLDLEVIIQNLYIKDCHQRRLKISSNVPNTTVMCVRKPRFIDKQSINLAESGVI